MSEIPPRITHTPKLVLIEATKDDVGDIREAFYGGFTDPFILKLFPKTAAQQKWWDDANSAAITQKPKSERYLIMKDMAPEAGPGGKVTAYAKWQCPTGDNASLDEFYPRFPPWSGEGDNDLCDRFFSTLSAARNKYFERKGEEQHYYLDMLSVIPEYRKMGIGGTLTEWGCKLADEHGKFAYIDASDMGGPVYVRYGFRPLEPINIPGETFTCTPYAREPKGKTV
ncbi:hypothetical protein BP5796_06493 [Coleophoma crateriformis]|uniref:N-acetyltransferase domain-containing protein n=1 Tax=Coleophoma crateriformis TaxID=565419 RepID=A0A3D8RNJ8_9HELO|nr:hypothetical protein BP5796_06493 [Coleophoma crateriformis]